MAASPGARRWWFTREPLINMAIAYVFPGQGSQSVGMLAELARQYPLVQTIFAEASDVLGYDLWSLVQEGPDTELNKTTNTQPALLAAGVAVWQVLQSRGVEQPAMLAGHSLGEYTALVCAGALKFSDAVSLVADRGRYMQESVPAGTGAMAAILGVDDDVVATVCVQASSGGIVSPANFNSPGQVVIAGESKAIERAISLAGAAGAKRSVMLPVSVPSHCALMRPAADKLAQRLQGIDIAAPTLPVVNNVDASVCSEADAIRDALVRQLYLPVRWVSVIQHMTANNVTQMVECGPGKVLTGLMKRIDRSLSTIAACSNGGIEKIMALTETV